MCACYNSGNTLALSLHNLLCKEQSGATRETAKHYSVCVSAYPASVCVFLSFCLCVCAKGQIDEEMFQGEKCWRNGERQAGRQAQVWLSRGVRMCDVYDAASLSKDILLNNLTNMCRTDSSVLALQPYISPFALNVGRTIGSEEGMQVRKWGDSRWTTCKQRSRDQRG